MKVLIIYCHPSKNSFTYEVKEAFIKGLESAGHVGGKVNLPPFGKEFFDALHQHRGGHPVL